LNNVGQYASLALDASGTPHVTISDQTTWVLKYAVKSGGAWSIETADSSDPNNNAFLGTFTSLALDANGNPHVTYRSTGSSTGVALKYAWKSGGGWTREFADSSTTQVGQFNHLELDALGNPHVSYEDFTNTNVRYARKTGGAWTIQYADSLANAGQYTSLALDAQGRTHITYFDARGLGELRYALASAPTSVASSFACPQRSPFFPIRSSAAKREFVARPPPECRSISQCSTQAAAASRPSCPENAGAAAGVWTWNALDAENRLLAPGVYFLRLVAGDRVESRRVTVIR
jgi:hypothetical protein